MSTIYNISKTERTPTMRKRGGRRIRITSDPDELLARLRVKLFQTMYHSRVKNPGSYGGDLTHIFLRCITETANAQIRNPEKLAQYLRTAERPVEATKPVGRPRMRPRDDDEAVEAPEALREGTIADGP